MRLRARRVGTTAALAIGFMVAARTEAGLGGANWSTAPAGNIDPQIAASADRVLITLYDRVYYYDKSGKAITHVGDDPAKPSLVTSLEDLFDPIRTDINTHLELPSGYTCNLGYQRDKTYEIHQDGNTRTIPNYCLTQYGFDARILWDEYRERFVIVAVAYNENSKCSHNAAANPEARRNKILVAYSATADPTDGKPWKLTWFDAVPGESCTTAACRKDWKWQPGESADYPSIAVTRNYLMVSISNQIHEKITSCPADRSDPLPHRTATVHVWNADALAARKFDRATCKGACSWVYYLDDLQYPDGSQVTGYAVVARTHENGGGDDAWFAFKHNTDPGRVLFWHFAGNGSATKPPLQRENVSVPSFTSRAYVNSYPPPPANGKTRTHAPLEIDDQGSLVHRNGKLYYADLGGVKREGSSRDDVSIRLVVLDVTSGGNQLALGGRHEIFGAADHGYGSVALDVNAQGDIAMTYRKVGDGAKPGLGARYLLWEHGTSATPTGHTLHDDEGTRACTRKDDDKCPTEGRQDTMGIALAPGGRFYVMQSYVNKSGSTAYAVNYIVP